MQLVARSILSVEVGPNATLYYSTDIGVFRVVIQVSTFEAASTKQRRCLEERPSMQLVIG